MIVTTELLLATAAFAVGVLGTCWSYARDTFSSLKFTMLTQVTVVGTRSIALAWKILREERDVFQTVAYVAGMARPPGSMLRSMPVLAARSLCPYYSSNSLCLARWNRSPIWVQIHSDAWTITGIRGCFDREAFLQRLAAEVAAFESQARTEGTRRFTVEHVFGSAGDSRANVHVGGSDERESSGPPSAEDEEDTEYLLNVTQSSLLVSCGLLNLIGASEPEDGESFPSLYLSPEVQRFLSLFHRCFRSQAFFREHKLPWRFGAALTGPPGNGKTSLVRYLAVTYDLPVYVFDLATLRDDELQREWGNVSRPCIALFEDLDCVFQGRKNVSGNEGGCNFGTLINCLDGIHLAAGVFPIITTNKPELLDPALQQRHGRIDAVVSVDPPTREGLRQIAESILKDRDDVAELLNRFEPGVSAAVFLGACRERALERFYDEEEVHTEREAEPESDLELAAFAR